ncbi:MAG: CHAD domain-containing protein [Deltaproteobacteria bacterium]|nr:CHAD domain-containing protein [Deltaproteobacteria bacterium]
MRVSEFIKKSLIRLANDVRRNIKRVIEGRDPEAVHDLRVSVRKLRTILRLLRKFFSKYYTNIIADELKEFFDKTSTSRDIEVSLALIGDMGIAKQDNRILEWYEKKKKAEYELKVELINYLRSNPYNVIWKKINAILLFPLKVEGDRKARELVIRRIRRIESRIMKLISEINSDIEYSPEMLHSLRILCKRLRYSIEFFKSLLPQGYEEEMKLMKRMQTSLGNLNDVFVVSNIVKYDNDLDDGLKLKMLNALQEKQIGYLSEIRGIFQTMI